MRAMGASAPKTARARRATPAPRPSSIPVLQKRAKTGDASAMVELVERASSRDQSTATGAVKAIGAIQNPIAWQALGLLMSESRNKGVTYVASRMLDRAVSKHPPAVEFLIRACENPAIDDDDVGLASLSDLVHDGKLRNDPRVLRIFRRALTASHPYAQEHAVTALATLHDVASRANITALLAQKKRGPDLYYVVAQALVKLDGGEAELHALEKARAKARPAERYGLDKAIGTLTRRLATSAAKKR
jgi:hypothetical protein